MSEQAANAQATAMPSAAAPDAPAAPTKRPFVTASQLEALVERFPTPFHLYDEAGIRATAQALNDAFSWNPGFREFYAVKACPNPAIINILREYGCGLDCATATELELARRMGVRGDEIMFSSNMTPDEDFALAAELGATINFDDTTQLAVYQRVAGALPQTVSLRLNPGGDFEGANGIFDRPQDAKFGMDPEVATIAAYRCASAGVTGLGLHALLCSNTLGDSYYPRLARLLFQQAVRIHAEVGLPIKFINLSGGVGIPYRPEDPMPNIAAIGEGVRRAFEEILVPAGLGDVAIYTELGRFMTGPHGCLVTRALYVKESYQTYLGVDACMADLMRPALYDAYHHITVVSQRPSHERYFATRPRTYDVVGGLCENNDRFANARELPEVTPGDLLVIHDTGAHGRSMGFNYNGKLRHAEVLLQPDGTARLIRRAETPDDYLATLDVLGGEFAAATNTNGPAGTKA